MPPTRPHHTTPAPFVAPVPAHAATGASLIVLGIDPGLTRANPCGFCLLDWRAGDPALLYHAAVWDKASPLLGIIAALDALPAPRLDGVAVEVPHLGLNVQTLARLAEVVGVVIGYAGGRGVPLLRCQPTQAKQALTGDPRADKPAMVAAVRQQFGAEMVKDAADAVGVAVWGAGQFARYAKEAA